MYMILFSLFVLRSLVSCTHYIIVKLFINSHWVTKLRPTWRRL